MIEREHADRMTELRDRIAELEAALRPFANLLLGETVEQIDPNAMYRLVLDQDDVDVTGREIKTARRLLAT